MNLMRMAIRRSLVAKVSHVKFIERNKLAIPIKIIFLTILLTNLYPSIIHPLSQLSPKL